MTNEQLAVYKEFRTSNDLTTVVDELNTSRTYYYYDSNNIRTAEVTDVLDLIEYDDNGYGHIDGCIVVELHHENGYIDPVEIPIEITLERWNEDDQCFEIESYSICDVEEW